MSRGISRGISRDTSHVREHYNEVPKGPAASPFSESPTIEASEHSVQGCPLKGEYERGLSVLITLLLLEVYPSYGLKG